MSDTPVADAVSTAVQKAVHDALAETGGGMLTGMVCWVDYVNADGEPTWSFVVADRQRMSTTLGLARCLTLEAERQVKDHLAEDDR